MSTQLFTSEWELNTATANNVLNLEFRESGIEIKLLHDACILVQRQLQIVLRLGTSDDLLAGSEDDSGSNGHKYV